MQENKPPALVYNASSPTNLYCAPGKKSAFQYSEKISNAYFEILISTVVIGIDGENYLWGLFVRSKGKSDPWQIGSTTT
jgi:hypothetical protein